MSRVYFIKPVGMDGPIKVGCSECPEGRRKTLDTWSPFALEIIAEIEGGFTLERRFHALFEETHQRREWFGWSRRIAAVVAAINDGTFDISTLPEPIKVVGRDRAGKGARAREWTPARRFGLSYEMRLRTLAGRGMPWDEKRPQFNATAYSTGDHAWRHRKHTDPVAVIRACEAYADLMTAKYGHSRMKPVRWIGPFPAPLLGAAA